MNKNTEWLQCVECENRYNLDDNRYVCECGGLLTIERPSEFFATIEKSLFDKRASSLEALDKSGVWRYRDCILNIDANDVVSHPEGLTHLYERVSLSKWSGLNNLWFKHEGENPTGSFKDRGMTVAVSQAHKLGIKNLICASTGNTSASLAAYAAQAGMSAIVLLPAGKIALGKLAQAIGYGATCLAVKGDFDAAMTLTQKVVDKFGLYLVNSLNPFRLEGQKSIVWEILQDLCWKAPDWIVVPAGNLGNTSTFGKALLEAFHAGWIEKVPRLASIQAEGANPFYRSFKEGFKKDFTVSAETVATAIRIGNPVNISKAKKSIELTNGLVAQVNDKEILEAKKQIDRSGIGCEPASAASLAGARKLVGEKVIKPDDKVVCILTGNILKDPDCILKSAEKSSTLINEIDPKISEVEKYLK